MAKVLNLQRRAPEPELREHGPTRLTKRIVEAIEPDPYRDVQRRDTGTPI